MKRTKRLFVMTALLAAAAVVQTFGQLQLKAGPSFCSMFTFNEPGVDKSFVAGFYFGVAKDIRLSERVFFQPNMMYSLQGYQIAENKYRLNYMLMPLNFKFDIGRNGGILLGPQVGILMWGKDGSGRTLTPALALANVALGVGPYFRASDRVTFGFRAIADLTNFDRSGVSDYLYNFVVQFGASWLVSKKETE